MTAPGCGGADEIREQLAEGHEHDWTDWVRPAVLRDSFGVVIDSAGVGIRRLTGTDQPVTPGWWRTCRTCPSEESASPAAEVEARVRAAANQRAAEAVEPGLSVESNGRRLAWFTDDELAAELHRRDALDGTP